MQYRREIDGLRAVAVLPVILFHAGFDTFAGGYVGVDVFFVISGYLITGTIVEEMAQGRFSIVRFYERRARRILPALFFVMACCIPIAYMWMDPFELKEFSQSVFATALFSSNIFFYLKSDYFDVSSELKPLLHTWSLAVEEQFYLVFPMVLLLSWRNRGTFVLRVLVLILVASFITAEWGSRVNPDWNFYLPFSRTWELMIGALCAIVLRNSPPRPNWIWSSAGLVAILSSIFLFDESTPFPSAYTLLPVSGAALIILYGAGASWTNRILSNRVFVGVGLVSYSAYLWHQPIFAFCRLRSIGELDSSFMLAAAGASLLLAVASHRFVEQPFRSLSETFLRRRAVIFGASALGIVLFSGFGLWIHLNKGIPERNALYARLAQNYGLSETCNGNKLTDKACRSTPEVHAVIWGDSYAMHIARPLSIAEAEAGIAQVTLSGCPPIVGYREARQKSLKVTCEEFNNLVFEGLKDDHGRIERVYVSSTFSSLIRNGADRIEPLFIGTIAALQDAGLDVVIVGPSPTAKYDVSKCLKRQMRASGDLSKCNFPVSQMSDIYTRKIDVLKRVASRTGAKFIDLQNVVCPDSTCLAYVAGRIIYRDAGHFSVESAALLAQGFRR